MSGYLKAWSKLACLQKKVRFALFLLFKQYLSFFDAQILPCSLNTVQAEVEKKRSPGGFSANGHTSVTSLISHSSRMILPSFVVPIRNCFNLEPRKFRDETFVSKLLTKNFKLPKAAKSPGNSIWFHCFYCSILSACSTELWPEKTNCF